MVSKKHLEDLVSKHGEVHVYIEEHETVTGSQEAIGIRDNDKSEFNSECVVLNYDEVHHVPYDSIVYVGEPAQFPD